MTYHFSAPQFIGEIPVRALDEVKIMHPSTAHLMQFFQYAHLPEHLQAVSKPAALLAEKMVEELPQNPELTAGLRKLLEAKDCFVRAKLAADG